MLCGLFGCAVHISHGKPCFPSVELTGGTGLPTASL